MNRLTSSTYYDRLRQIDAIFTAPDDTYCVSTMSALKEAANLKPALTKKAAEETLENLINHRWLHRSE